MEIGKEDYPEELTDFYSSKNFCDGNSYEEDYKKAVRYAKRTGGQLYTMVDGEDNHTHYLKGLHYVNRFGFCVLIK